MYREKDFEAHIEEPLLNSGYVKRLPTEYDKDLCLIPDEVIQFLQSTQPREYEKLERQYGAETPQKLCVRLARELSQKGTLHVLRKGIKDRGARFQLAFYKPHSGMNPEHLRLYGLNRFVVLRQLQYSKKVVERTSERLIFPRFHQLDVVRKLLAAVRQEGVGHDYLVQHSAGSGKSNSIAWLAHQLASFYQHHKYRNQDRRKGY